MGLPLGNVANGPECCHVKTDAQASPAGEGEWKGKDTGDLAIQVEIRDYGARSGAQVPQKKDRQISSKESYAYFES